MKNFLGKNNKSKSQNLNKGHNKNKLPKTMSFNDNTREFVIQLPSFKNNKGNFPKSNRKMPSIYKNKKYFNFSGGMNTSNNASNNTLNNTLNNINSIRIKIGQKQIQKETKKVMEVYLNDKYLYVFFKQGEFFKLMRRCDQEIIGNITQDINKIPFFL